MVDYDKYLPKDKDINNKDNTTKLVSKPRVEVRVREFSGTYRCGPEIKNNQLEQQLKNWR